MRSTKTVTWLMQAASLAMAAVLGQRRRIGVVGAKRDTETGHATAAADSTAMT